MSAAKLINVSKRYGNITALAGVDLEVQSGEVLSILGPNGAGKTTSVHLMLGLIDPDAGQVRLFDQHPRRLSARRKTGVMLQIGGVPTTLTVAEHLRLFASYYPHPLTCEQAIAAAGLDGLENRRVGKLSGGQRQRLMFALALIGDPALLFLDEPTAGLDVAARRRFWQTIRAFKERGHSVVLTTHYLEEADALADRIAVLNEGRIVAIGTPGEIKRRAASRRVSARTRVELDQVKGFNGVRNANRDGASLELLCNDAESVVRRLLELDPHLTDLEVTGAGLEQAFLSLTENHERTS